MSDSRKPFYKEARKAGEGKQDTQDVQDGQRVGATERT